MAQKPWFQANIHAPGTGFALLVIAFCLLLQTIPSAICVLTPRTGWDPPLSPESVWYSRAAEDALQSWQKLGGIRVQVLMALNLI